MDAMAKTVGGARRHETDGQRRTTQRNDGLVQIHTQLALFSLDQASQNLIVHAITADRNNAAQQREENWKD